MEVLAGTHAYPPLSTRRRNETSPDVGRAGLRGSVHGRDHFDRRADFAFPPNLPALDGNGAKALGEMIDAGAHATLAFAQSASAVEGTDKGEANGQYQPEFKGSQLRR
jgi:hypothetical protein